MRKVAWDMCLCKGCEQSYMVVLSVSACQPAGKRSDLEIGAKGMVRDET